MEQVIKKDFNFSEWQKQHTMCNVCFMDLRDN